MTALLLTLAVVLALGAILRRAQGRVRRPASSRPTAVHVEAVRPLGIAPGATGTVVEVTTARCTDCEATYRVLTETLAGREGIAVHRLSADAAPHVLREWNVLQAPTTFVFGPAGSLVARVGGRASRAAIETALEGLPR